jgi:signal transduction histidine kinase
MQIILNLQSNAIKFTQEGFVKILVKLTRENLEIQV